MISEAKMKIVIDNYFKSECNVDTSIRQAFEKGFHIGVQKGITLQPERKKGKWLMADDIPSICSNCGANWIDDYVDSSELYFTGEIPNYCPECGADMRGERE